MKLKKTVKWVRWLGAVASGLTLFVLAVSARHFLGWGVTDRHSKADLLLYLGLAVLPSVVAVVLTLSGRFWGSFWIGLWLTFLSVIFVFDQYASPQSMILLLAAATVCITPFLNYAFAGKIGTTDVITRAKDSDTEA